MKNHKDNCTNNPTYCLINPSKNELGKISKSILERVNKTLVEQLKNNRWKNNNNVIEWFENITNKQNCIFIRFDIKQFYPSITEEILDTAIIFAKSHSDINKVELRTIKHCRKSLLFSNNEAWKKKSTDSCFDVTMGSYGGTEICELVGIYTEESITHYEYNFRQSGYNKKLAYKPTDTNHQKHSKHKRKIIWFSPRFSKKWFYKNRKMFLKPVDLHFLKKNTFIIAY